MNILKRISGIIISAIVLFTIVFLPDNRVSAAGLSVSVSASKVNVGQTVTATVSIPSGYGATVAVSFDSSVLTYSSCSVTASANGGTVVLNIGDAMGYSNSATITFKASSAGTSNISASATTAGDEEGESVDLSGASKSVTVQNKADSSSDKKEDSNNNNNNDNNNDNNNSDDNKEDSNSTKSADNSLKSLVLSAGALSPKFSPSTTSYTATVDYSVTSIAITAVPSNSKASVVSVSGNEGLKVGANTVTIIVKAENGVTSTYTITVTREEEKDDEPEVVPVSFTVNGNTLYCINDIPDDVVPEDFEKSQITIDNNNCASLNFLNGDIKLLYLGAEDGTNASLYVYDAKEGAVYSFVKLSSENSYIILLLPDVSGLPEGYEESALSIEGKGVVTAYKSPDNEFYLVYAMNNSGNTRWYQFDEEEYTYQRYVGHIENVVPSTEEAVETIGNTTNDDDQIEKLQQKLNRTYIFSGIIILILLLICLAMYLLMKSNNRPESNHVNVADSEYVDELSDADMDDTDSEYVDESGDDYANDDYTDDTDNDYVDESSDADTDNIDNEYSAESNEVDNEDNSNEENYNESEDDVYLEKIDISEFYSSEEQIKKGDSTNLKNEEEAEVRAMLADAEKLLKEAMASTHVEDDEEESDVEFLDID